MNKHTDHFIRQAEAAIAQANTFADGPMHDWLIATALDALIMARRSDL